MNNSSSKVLTATEAAAFLNISVSSVKVLSDKNMIPSWKTPGGHRRYDQNELANYKFKIRRNLRKLNAKIIILTIFPKDININNEFDPSGLLEIHIVKSLSEVYLSFSECIPDAIIFEAEDGTLELLEKIASLKELINQYKCQTNLICFTENKNIKFSIRNQNDNLKVIPSRHISNDWLNAFILGFIINLK